MNGGLVRVDGACGWLVRRWDDDELKHMLASADLQSKDAPSFKALDLGQSHRSLFKFHDISLYSLFKPPHLQSLDSGLSRLGYTYSYTPRLVRVGPNEWV